MSSGKWQKDGYSGWCAELNAKVKAIAAAGTNEALKGNPQAVRGARARAAAARRIL